MQCEAVMAGIEHPIRSTTRENAQPGEVLVRDVDVAVGGDSRCFKDVCECKGCGCCCGFFPGFIRPHDGRAQRSQRQGGGTCSLNVVVHSPVSSSWDS